MDLHRCNSFTHMHGKEIGSNATICSLKATTKALTGKRVSDPGTLLSTFDPVQSGWFACSLQSTEESHMASSDTAQLGAQQPFAPKHAAAGRIPPVFLD